MKTLLAAPVASLRAELLYKHASGFYAGPNVEWAPGHHYADNANALAVDSYTLSNLKAGYDADAHWSFYIDGRNLTDKRYISTAALAGEASEASEIFNPGTGRAVFGGLRYKW
ncbi:TonB-dependent receptor [Allosphingosinicella vermicomposti]|uniref:TonB-dependent receptor n=1 Tax=Allosphingosinicella vermicomposti TaxID=614671 RepID=UPI000D10220F|nr:TonB-dependent receptor [Allosphingosinicella vermicomposti]